MRRILFHVPGLDLPIYAYGFMLMIGFVLGILLAGRRAKKAGLDPNAITDLALWLIVFGVVGARFFYVLEFRDQFSFAFFNPFDLRYSVIGLLAGAALSTLVWFRGRQWKVFRWFFDGPAWRKRLFWAAAVLLTLVVGRLSYMALEPGARRHVVTVMPRERFDAKTLRTVERYGEERQSWEWLDFFNLPHAEAVASVTYGLVTDERSEWFNKRRPLRVSYDPSAISAAEVREAWKERPHVSFEEGWSFSVFEVWKGGLVYYGGVIGGIIAGLLFCWRRKIPFFKIADIVAPSLMLGLACGRFGCTMNGCCWGKIPDEYVACGNWLAVPEKEMSRDERITLMLAVRRMPPGAARAAAAEVAKAWRKEPGRPVREILLERGLISRQEWSRAARQARLIGPTLPVLRHLLIRFPPARTEKVLKDGYLQEVVVIPEPPVHGEHRAAGLAGAHDWTLPVYPTQPLSAATALLWCVLTLVYSRKWQRRRGEAILLIGALYPVGRFVIEFLRGDNDPSYLFGLTVSQTVGLFFVPAVVAFWLLRNRWLVRRGETPEPEETRIWT